jgi:hypothetical protein
MLIVNVMGEYSNYFEPKIINFYYFYQLRPENTGLQAGDIRTRVL